MAMDTEEVGDGVAPQEAQELPPVARLMDLTTAPWITQAISAVAGLGVPDHLGRVGEAPRTADELAAAVGADGPSLRRVLRALTHVGVVASADGDRFAATELSELLRTDNPGSLRAWAQMVGAPFHMRALTDLVGAIRTGEPAFERVHRQVAFDWFRDHPESAAVFNAAMTGASSPPIAEVLTAYDFVDATNVLDVGGGHGAVLAAVLRAHPHLRGAVFDLPEVVPGAGAVFEAAGVADRAGTVAGDFFEAVPPGADVHVLANILHDWDDERCVRILRNCRSALEPGGRVLLAEGLLDGPDPATTAVVDLEMLVMGTGRQRSTDELRALFRQAGLELSGVGPSGPLYSVVEAVPAG